MQIVKKKLAASGVQIPKILLPAKNVDLNKWCVIACDQYTSDFAYWKRVKNHVGSSPSTLKIILPEAYLDSPGKKRMLSRISREMRRYLRFQILQTLEEGFVYIRRTTSYGNIRNGLLACVDLERYSYTSHDALIRPTEKTILNRIPPRLEVRAASPLELPHIMLLLDDPERKVVEPFEHFRNSLTKLYDVSLMENGGQVQGYLIHSTVYISRLAQLLNELAEKSPFLFAVGDGNHSMACAKQHWENLKLTLSMEDAKNHPARFALTEIVNIHDRGLVFHPIHRVLAHVESKVVLDAFRSIPGVILEPVIDVERLQERVEQAATDKDCHSFGVMTGKGCYLVRISGSSHILCAGTVQEILDRLVEQQGGTLEYIHHPHELSRLVSSGQVGFLLPPLSKKGFFETIHQKGTLPVKCFSIGHADEKRFYLEARKIVL